jgi:outer membrane protein OmpA-like peptidoglycan-associated protein
MRTLILALALVGAGMAVLGPWPARAQVRIDTRAVEQLAPTPARLPPAETRGTHHPTPAADLPLPPPPPPPLTARPATPPPASAAVPAAAPPPPVLPPPLTVPTRPPPAPPPVPVVASASGTATPMANGLRITFGRDSASLNPVTAAALTDLCHRAPADADFVVATYAPGSADDPSSPRRLALERGLAVRAVLLARGISSPHIFLHAYGASHGIAAGPVDRADITLTPPPPPARPAP